MLKKDLILEIKENLIKYPPLKPIKHINKEDIYDLLILYNFNNYNSFLLENSYLNNIIDEEIPDEKINNLKNRIENYFEKYSPNDKNLKEFTKYITLYLYFIAKKPLHPIGKIKNEYEVKKENNEYYCKNKREYLKDKDSLCVYCVCKIMD